jgi:hypothetical protein
LAKIRLPEKIKVAGIALAGMFSMLFGQPGIDPKPADSVKVSVNDLESKVMSTLMFGGSNPVSFSGEGRLKLQYHDFRECPDYARRDRSWTQTNWEGNENLLRLGMVVHVNRNTVLWSKIGFQSTLPGIYTNAKAFEDGFFRRQTKHDKLEETAVVHEDMCAGLAIRTVPASFWLKMGSIIWTEASPLTIWKSQPRNVAWDFLPYEIEQPIARYYEYNIAKGAKEGRASWHKKALQGINLESINLPWDLYFNAVYGVCERYDSGEREFIDWSNDLAYTDGGTEAKQRGIGDSYHYMFHCRLAKSKVASGLTLGLNYISYMVEDDIGTSSMFKKIFIPVKDSAFYKEPQIASIDVKGSINQRLEMQADIAMSMMDTTFIKIDSVAKGSSNYKGRSSLTPMVPAFYGRLKSTYGVPATIDLAYISKGFYSPLSFAAPADAFYPFGSNLVGAGKFICRGEASPYVQNMAGAVLGIAPDIGGYGHLRFMYGQHFQVQTARDLIFFPYRLNGQDFYGLFKSSYNCWDQGPFDVPLPAQYQKRLGDESFRQESYQRPVGPDGGGMRLDYLSTRDGFVPYESAAEALANYQQGMTKSTETNLYTRSQYVPQHRKFTFNLESDIAYDINKLIGYDKDFFLSFYGAINGVSTKVSPIAFSQKDQLLWSLYLRFEPAIALSNKFFIIGLTGYENWRSDKAWMYFNNTVVSSPIDFRDVAFGLGFDWEMASRTGLHVRLKWMQHEDVNFTKNNWATPVISTEIKMWY